MTVYSSYDANNVLKLRFDDYQSFDISNIQYDGYYLKISNSTTGSYYNLDLPHLQQTNLEFADGVKTRLQIPETGTVVFTGTTASEWILGGSGAETYQGKQGNDRFFGGDGQDVYLFAKGDGIDTISDFSGKNIIRLSNVKSTEVDFSIEKGELNIHYGTNDVIKIPHFLANNLENFSIEFADGVKINHADLDAKVGIQYWVRGLVASANTDADFKYTFPQIAPDYLDAEDRNGWAALPSPAQSYLEEKFAELSGYTGLTFTETINAKQKNVISVQLNQNPTESSGYGYYPSSGYIGSDIFFDKEYGDDPLTKTWQKFVFPHELGHTLGLRYSFDAPTIQKFSTVEESTSYTVMSYNQTTGYDDGDFKDFDIAALQAMYGVNTTQRTGNNSYQFNASTGVFVWDGTGLDTLTASNATASAYLDLNEGSWSYIGVKSAYISSANQLTINLGTKIENAIGGKYNDILIGNRLNNVLNGGAGADTMTGGKGNDTYYVDHINDKIVEYKNEGLDTVYLSVSYSIGSAFVDNMILTGTAHINATGNSVNNRPLAKVNEYSSN